MLALKIARLRGARNFTPTTPTGGIVRADAPPAGRFD
jgi:hypothetical protein